MVGRRGGAGRSRPRSSGRRRSWRARAREQGLSLTGPEGLLKQLTRQVLETALDQELTGHLGHEKNGQPVAGNVRNGTRFKTVLTEASGQVGIEVPRDRAGTFEPQIVKKRQRRLSGVDEIVLSLSARGLATGGDQRALRGDLRCLGEQGDDQPDHRRGHRGDAVLAEPAAGYEIYAAIFIDDGFRAAFHCGVLANVN